MYFDLCFQRNFWGAPWARLTLAHQCSMREAFRLRDEHLVSLCIRPRVFSPQVRLMMPCTNYKIT